MSSPSTPLFDDFLGIMTLDLTNYRLLIFHGCSGSGKSHYLKQLSQHPSFINHDLCWFHSDPSRAGKAASATNPGAPRLALVDELTSVQELPGLAGLLRRFDTVAVATHLNPHWYSLFRMRWKARVFQTDHDDAKIVRYLTNLGHDVQAEDVRAMCSRYGASYAAADIIRKHHPHPDFSECWDRFRRFAKLVSRPHPAHRHWRLHFD